MKKEIFRSPMLWLGFIFQFLIVYYLIQRNDDLNDMNELVINAITMLFSGENPYQFYYQITINSAIENIRNTYSQWFSYPPMTLILYAPVMFYPEMVGNIQINYIMYLENLVFDFGTFYLLWDPKSQVKRIAAYCYWLNPYLGYMQVVTFYSSMFFFIVLSLRFIDKPIQAGIAAATAALIYHLSIFYIISLVFYIIRAKNINIEPNLDLSKIGKRFQLLISMKSQFHRTFLDLSSVLNRIFKFMFGFCIISLILILFLIWDWHAVVNSLFEQSANRYNVAIGQYVFIGISSVIFAFIILIENDISAKLYMLICDQIFYFALTFLLNWFIDYFYFHYFILLLPFTLMMIYEIGEWVENRNKK